MLVEIEQVPIGSVLSRDLYSDELLLLRAGSKISQTMLNTLMRRGFRHLPIDVENQTEVDYLRSGLDALSEYSRECIVKMNINRIVDSAYRLIDSIANADTQTAVQLLLDFDESTCNHSQNVALLNLTYGFANDFDLEHLRILALGGLLHDMGKLLIPISIIRKPARLTEGEFEIVKTHPTLGYGLVKDYSVITTPVKQIILQHHENANGTGYPKGLDKNHSYNLARLTHISDSYEALSARRAYKPPMLKEEVLSILLQGSNTLYDESILRDFTTSVPLHLLGEEVYVDGHTAVVVDNRNARDPLVMYREEQMRLSVFVKRFTPVVKERS